MTPGQRVVVWVADGGDIHSLYCIDARSGAVLQRWPNVAGDVTSISGNAFAIHGAAVHPLHLNDACTG